MPGRHRNRNSFNRTIALRFTGGVVAGAALMSSVAATYADNRDAASASQSDMLAGAQHRTAADRGKSRTAARAHGKPVRARDLLAVARKQIGISDGSGTTKFQQWYMRTPRAKQTVARDGGSVGDYATAEWCDMFVSWVGNQVGLSRTVGEDPWTVAHAHWFKAQHRWGTKPKPGAVVFFSWSGGTSIDSIDHVGLVVKDNRDGTIQTIEGNVDGGRVEGLQRDTSQVVGYGYPVYAK